MRHPWACSAAPDVAAQATCCLLLLLCSLSHLTLPTGRHQHLNHQPTTLSRAIRFLWFDYSDRYFWFEMVDFAEKFLLIGVVSLFHPE